MHRRASEGSGARRQDAAETPATQPTAACAARPEPRAGSLRTSPSWSFRERAPRQNCPARHRVGECSRFANAWAYLLWVRVRDRVVTRLQSDAGVAEHLRYLPETATAQGPHVVANA